MRCECVKEGGLHEVQVQSIKYKCVWCALDVCVQQLHSNLVDLLDINIANEQAQ